MAEPRKPVVWRCRICGAERPDARIAVWTHHRALPVPSTGFGAVRFEEHVRYCADRPACREAAARFHFLPLRPEEALGVAPAALDQEPER